VAFPAAVRTQITARLAGATLLRQVALLALLIITAGFWIYFSAAAAGFTSDFNLFSLLRFAAIQITIGFAQMVALSIGDLNLAVGAIGGAAGMVAGWVMQSLGLPPEVAIGVALAAGHTAWIRQRAADHLDADQQLHRHPCHGQHHHRGEC